MRLSCELLSSGCLSVFVVFLFLCFLFVFAVVVVLFLLCSFSFLFFILRQLVVETRLLSAPFKVYYNNFSSMEFSMALFHLNLGRLLLVLKQFACTSL